MEYVPVSVSKQTMKYSENCPVCGFTLGYKPWIDSSASDEICPSCGIQFGYDDMAGGNEDARKFVYLGWRLKWRKDGYHWYSKSVQPKKWDPTEQIKNVSEKL
jgi:hypothetical protein